MKTAKRILCLILCLVLTIPLAACGQKATVPEINPGGIPDYVEFDEEELKAKIEKFSDIIEAGKIDDILSAYDELYQDMLQLNSMAMVAYYNYSQNVNDEYWPDESERMDNMIVDIEDLFLVECHELTQSDLAQEFKEHIDENCFATFEEYQPMTEEEKQLSEQVNAIVKEYYEASNKIDEYTYSYNGKDWCYSDLSGDEIEELYYNEGTEAYTEVYEGIFKAINAALGQYYLELVPLYIQMAELAGYDDFAEYAYVNEFGRDYTPAEAQEFCDLVKKYATEDLEGFADTMTTLYYFTRIDEEMTSEDLITLLGAAAANLDPMTEQSYQYLTELNLYSIGYEEDRMDNCYAADLAQETSAVIFMCQSGTSRDYSALTHEFGHFTHMLYSDVSNYFAPSSYDEEEIHSNGLQILMSQYYEDAFGDYAGLARMSNVSELASTIIDGCIEDEFQRSVYANPDMTLEEMNELHAQIELSYGVEEPSPYWWTMISHHFERPMYYISYAVSAFSALEIWQIMEKNPDKALEIWKALVLTDSKTVGLEEAKANVGLSSITDEKAVKKVMSSVFEWECDMLNENIDLLFGDDL